MNACPSPLELQHFLDGVLSPDACDVLDAHIETCIQCQTQLQQLAKDVGMDELARPATAVTSSAFASRAEPGTQIGPYKLVQKLGEGGMGEVWEAEQSSPLQRKVALKFIRPELVSRSVLARFEQERHAISRMDHPHIAKVLDAGTTPDLHQPYFVMELVRGLPITKYSDREQLTVNERLTLFISVCEAVGHAHQKGIIHRDLKPSNVIVGKYDGKPVAKVIDFGVAKAIHHEPLENSPNTEVDTIIGTLEYMAPEQAEHANDDIDTRADIYGLGAVLYELLSGSPPFTGQQLRSVSYSARRKLIVESEPLKPSTRLSNSEDGVTIATNRKSEARRLAKLVAGELDWIVMKCLEKDRDRRYESASALAGDLTHFLHDEPVTARPPSRIYRLRKFVRRNSGAVLAASLLFVSLVGGIIGTSAGMMRAKAERNVSETRLRHIEKAREILASIIRDLDPSLEEKEGIPLRVQLGQRLELAATLLESEPIGDPVTAAKLQNTIGATQLALGHPRPALSLLSRALQTLIENLSADHPDTLSCRNNLAETYRELGQAGDAIRLHEENVQFRISRSGPDAPETLLAQDNLAAAYLAAGRDKDAVRLHEQTFHAREQKFGREHRATAASCNNLAEAYRAVGRWEDALHLLQESLNSHEAKLGPNHQLTCQVRNNLAGMYSNLGNHTEAVRLLEDNQKRQTSTLGHDHPDTFRTQNNLALAYADLGDNAKALGLLEAILKLRESKLGYDHPETLNSRNNVGMYYVTVGRIDDAIRLHELNLELREAKFGDENDATCNSRNNLANAYFKKGRVDEALALFVETLKVRQKILGPGHPKTLVSQSNLATLYLELNKPDSAIPLLEVALQESEKQLGPSHEDTIHARNSLASGWFMTGRLEDAIRLLTDNLHFEEAQLDSGHPRIVKARHDLATLYFLSHRYADAEPLISQNLQLLRPKLRPDSGQLLELLVALGECQVNLHRFAEAEPHLRESLSIFEKKQPESPTRGDTQSLLGAALAGQKKYDEAEPHALAGYEHLKQRAATLSPADRPLVRAALERLISLYEGWGKSDEVAKWRKDLDSLNDKL